MTWQNRFGSRQCPLGKPVECMHLKARSFRHQALPHRERDAFEFELMADAAIISGEMPVGGPARTEWEQDHPARRRHGGSRRDGARGRLRRDAVMPSRVADLPVEMKKEKPRHPQPVEERTKKSCRVALQSQPRRARRGRQRSP